ncbi:unnamed protein product [Cylicostephanus goldi]|uniref:Uncharacterized protein n=1 Tax=Cylicostephanus goldi TaxID=71465 RepID=A0A3P6SB23_CYLGO|nr:unnamed protein product [Cylicostephanus goldi]
MLHPFSASLIRLSAPPKKLQFSFIMWHNQVLTKG